eukprot:5810893-Pyramimonas_sp.AAC.1
MPHLREFCPPGMHHAGTTTLPPTIAASTRHPKRYLVRAGLGRSGALQGVVPADPRFFVENR